MEGNNFLIIYFLSARYCPNAIISIISNPVSGDIFSLQNWSILTLKKIPNTFGGFVL